MHSVLNNFHLCILTKHFIMPKGNSIPLKQFLPILPPLNLWPSLAYALSLWIYCEYFIQYMTFYVWLLSWWLTFLAWCFRVIHIIYSIYHYIIPSLWLSNILLDKHVCFYFQGVNGSINGNSTSSVSGINTPVLSTTASSSVGQTKSLSSGGGNRKCNQEQNKNQPLDARADKIKDKVSYSFQNKCVTDLYVSIPSFKLPESMEKFLMNYHSYFTNAYFYGLVLILGLLKITSVSTSINNTNSNNS